MLSLLGLLTVLALGALSATRRHAQLARTSFALVQQRELADSAMRVAILEIAASEHGASLTSLDRRSFELFGQAVTVDVQLEAGRIDLNFADELLLVAAFAAHNIGENEARRLAARIVDWRDAEDTVGTQGAEHAEYRRAGRTGPRNGPFEHVSELRLVLGAELLPENVLDAFTVYSHQGDVRQDAPVPAVMNALRWAQARQLGGRTWLHESAVVSRTELQGGLAGHVLRLRACTTAHSIETCRTSIFRLTGDQSNPVLISAWY